MFIFGNLYDVVLIIVVIVLLIKLERDLFFEGNFCLLYLYIFLFGVLILLGNILLFFKCMEGGIIENISDKYIGIIYFICIL